jgi:hypothetical protein
MDLSPYRRAPAHTPSTDTVILPLLRIQENTIEANFS